MLENCRSKSKLNKIQIKWKLAWLTIFSVSLFVVAVALLFGLITREKSSFTRAFDEVLMDFIVTLALVSIKFALVGKLYYYDISN